MHVTRETRAMAMTTLLSEEDAVWSVFDDYFNTVSPVAHQIDSYNYFVKHLIPSIFTEASDVSYMHSNGKESHHIVFTNVACNPPSSQESDGFYKPISPFMARLRGLTYSSCVTVDVVHDRVDQTKSPPEILDRKVYRNVIIAQIPVMIRSCLCCLSSTHDDEFVAGAKAHECSVDSGGYFIIAGNEKVIVPQCKLRTNHVFVFPCKTNDLPKFKLCAEIRSCHEAKLRSTSTLYMLVNDISRGDDQPHVQCRLPFLKAPLSLFVLFSILGNLSKTNEMMAYFGQLDEETECVIRYIFDCDPKNGNSCETILDWVGKNVTTETTKSTKLARNKYVTHILVSEIFPHMGLSDNAATRKKKCIFLAHMTTRLISVALGKQEVDDRDDIENKRVDSAGSLMALLVRQHYRGNLLRKLNTFVRKEVEKGGNFNVGDSISHKLITSGLRYAFATGTWGIQRGAGVAGSGATGAGGGGQTGVVQILPRLTTMATLGGLRKLNVPVSREGRTTGPRMLHPSSWGYICPSDTPEGSACGLVTSLALTAHLRIGAPMEPIAKYILKNKNLLRETSSHSSHSTNTVRIVRIEDINDNLKQFSPIHVNGTIVGYIGCDDSSTSSLFLVNRLATALRKARQNGDIPFDCSISTRTDGSLFVSSDIGCLLRPLIVASRIYDFYSIARQPNIQNKYNLLISEGIVQLIDASETSNCRIAIRHTDLLQDNDFTHAELHPSSIVGVCVSQIPFADHNQSPRVAYQAAQCKQAIGLYTTNFAERLDTIAHVLCTPQRALVTTKYEELLGTSVVRSGAVPIVAIMSYSGFNQDDSVLLSQSAIDRGLFHTFSYHTHRDEERQTGADIEKFENPANIEGCGGMKLANYSKIGPDGLPIIGESYGDGDVIIGKTVAISTLQTDPSCGEARRSTKRDRSTILKTDELVVVDAIFTSKNAEGATYVKVRTRSLRIPIVGDKVSARHGQKGVCGAVFSAADFPYTKSGIQPDIIVNPHAIPSRMTIGMIMEMLLGKVGCLEEETQDGTAFCGASMQKIADRLEENGYSRHGGETLYNGMTGEALECDIFIAPCYYQRLKHMVVEKAHARNRGARQLLTRAPTEGRSRDGGLRIGEMEKDSICSWGAAHVLQDRLFEQSDAFECFFCKECGDFSDKFDEEDEAPLCKHCESNGKRNTCVSVQMPFAMKLLLQEIRGCGISTRLHF